MKCENCAACAGTGYGQYCAAGVPDSSAMATADGCRYSWAIIRRRMANNDKKLAAAYDDCVEWFKESQAKESAVKELLQEVFGDVDINDAANILIDYEAREKEIQRSLFCDRCKYGQGERPQKCATCRRNRGMKDNFAEK